MGEWLGGVAPASPTATPMRSTSSWTNPPASPHKAVKPDQARIQAANTRVRSRRSASRASGKPSTV